MGVPPCQTLVNQGVYLKGWDTVSKDGNVYKLNDLFLIYIIPYEVVT